MNINEIPVGDEQLAGIEQGETPLVDEQEAGIKDCTSCKRFMLCNKKAPKNVLPTDLTICENFEDNFAEDPDDAEIDDLIASEEYEYDDGVDAEDDDIMSEDEEDVK